VITTINLAQKLSVSKSKVASCLVMSVGSKVNKDEVIARKKGLFSKIEITAPVSGEIESLNDNGELVIAVKSEEPQLETEPIKKTKNSIKAVFGSGSCEGKLIFIEGVLEFTKIDENFDQAIICAETMNSVTTFYKASAIGIKGIVLTWLKPAILDKIDKTVLKTGHMAFLILDKIQNQDLTKKISKLDSSKVAIDGNTPALNIL